MALGLNDSQSNVVEGVGTWTYLVLAAGYFGFQVTSFLSPPSSLSIIVSQNGTPIKSNPAPTASQSHIELVDSAIPCAIGDVLSFVFSSASSTDIAPNNVHSLITIFAGNFNTAA